MEPTKRRKQMKPLTKVQIEVAVQKALKTGRWMIRRSSDGVSYQGFQWKPVGCWTVAPDWDGKPECGGGLHGNGPTSTGYWTAGLDVDFCVIGGGKVKIDAKKIKVQKAMILLRNKLPDNLKVGGSLYLRDTKITKLPDNLKVGGYLDLRDTKITKLPAHLKRKTVY